jgi:hypothetical protein
MRCLQANAVMSSNYYSSFTIHKSVVHNEYQQDDTKRLQGKNIIIDK